MVTPAVQTATWAAPASIDADGASYPGNGGLDGGGYAYSGALLGSQVSWDGQAFDLGPVGSADAVSATGQTIALPSASYSQLLNLGTGVDGDQAGQTFTVHYSDGTSATMTQGFSDRYFPQHYAGESVAATMAYRDSGAGVEQALASAFNLYGYAEPLNAGKSVVSVTLPNDPQVEILAMDLVSATAAASPRNLGYSLDCITTANLDVQQQYRGRLNVLDRPGAAGGGGGIALTGHHELLIPLLHAAVVARTRARR